MNRSGGFEDSFGERLWPSLRLQIIRSRASLILALDIACEVILHTMRCLLPPCLDFITGPHGDFVLQAKSGKALFNGLLDDALERDLTPLGWEASLTIQDDREKTDLLQAEAKSLMWSSLTCAQAAPLDRQPEGPFAPPPGVRPGAA